jgi:hypothetical protein
MKKEHVLMMAVTSAVIVVIGLRFGSSAPDPVAIGDPAEITVHDMGDKDAQLADILAGTPESYILLLELDNCPTCLYKGMRDIEALVKAGQSAYVVVVDDWQSEVQGWSKHYPDVPVFRMAKDVFYGELRASHLPVLLKLANTELVSHRFITVN